jgi:hypothetical protein
MADQHETSDVVTTERVSIDIPLLRGTAAVNHRTTSPATGVHYVRVPLGAGVPGGRVIVDVAAKGRARNTKVITTALRVLARAS